MPATRGNRRLLLRSRNTHSGVKVWVPKSVIDDESEVFSAKEDENSGTLVVQRWFAEKEGLG